MGRFEGRNIIRDKRFWFASFLIAWAAALQGHMMWLQKQDSFKQKFGTAYHEDDVSQGGSRDALESDNQ